MVRAVKIIHKLSETNENKLFLETDILKDIDHPNIVKIYEIFVDVRHYYIVTEFCEGYLLTIYFIIGGELFERISSITNYSERLTALYMK